MALLEVSDLVVELETPRGRARALRGVEFVLEAGRTLGIVGESGSGKSITALALMGLAPEGARLEGRVRLAGQELLGLPEAEMQRIRGRRMAMIFQEPMTSLNPVHRVGRQIGEALALHRALRGPEARAEATRLLARVGLPRPERLVDAYPHELSGGQRQRVMIAMALSCGPDVLIADEPTTALDVTIQERILGLINHLVDADGMALIMISHDFGVIARTCEEVLIMYAGLVVERGATRRILEAPAHPYSRGLIAAVPRLGQGRERGREARLRTIPGVMAELDELPAGCPFADRCDLADQGCVERTPGMRAVAVDGTQAAACHKLDPVEAVGP